MQSIENYLTGIFGLAFNILNLPDELGQVFKSTRKEYGHFQCNGSLAGAKKLKIAPTELATRIINEVQSKHGHIFNQLKVAGPGFINITISQEFLNTYTNQAFHNKEFGVEKITENQTVIIDYGGPNIAKPMHVGHLRSSIIGNAIYRLFKKKGYKTISDIHLGDWGTQMGMIICELQKRNPNLPYFNPPHQSEYPQEPPLSLNDLEEIYPHASKKCKEDPIALADAQKATVDLQNGHPGYLALWKHIVNISVDGLKKDYQDLGISFDLWEGESSCHEEIPIMLNDLNNKKTLCTSNGAQAIFFTPKELNEKKEDPPPLLLVKSDGAYLYGTTDLATLYKRIDKFAPNKIVYVADARQSLHFKQIFCAYNKANPKNKTNLVHVGFGTVNGIDGKPFKTRAGGVMKLRDLIDLAIEKATQKMEEEGIGKNYTTKEKIDIAKKVGISAIKYADLINNRNSNYIFDLDRFISFTGKTGPYLIYSAVRIKSIFRKNKILDSNYLSNFQILLENNVQNDLALCVLRMPDIINQSTETYLPHILAEHLFELAQTFNRFYQECNIISESNQAKKENRLALCHLVLTQLELGLDLLGIEIPEKM